MFYANVHAVVVILCIIYISIFRVVSKMPHVYIGKVRVLKKFAILGNRRRDTKIYISKGARALCVRVYFAIGFILLGNGSMQITRRFFKYLPV